MADVDPALLYRLLVAKVAYQSKYVPDVGSGDANLRVKLLRSPFTDRKADVAGRILDAKNRPVAAAAIIPRGFTRGNMGKIGPMDDIATAQVTDADGCFSIYAAKPVDVLDLEVRARGFVSTRFNNVPTGSPEVQALRLCNGISIHGRLLKENYPVAGAAMGAAWTTPNSSDYFGPWEAITDSDGRFSLSNVTAGHDVYLYGKMSSFKGVGGVEAIRLKTGESGTVLDAGDISVSVGHKITGRIVIGTGERLLPGTNVFLGRDGLSDHLIVGVDKGGTFEVKGVPSALYGIDIVVSDGKNISLAPYHLTSRNRSVDPTRRSRLLGRVDEDVDIIIGLDPGLAPFPSTPNTRLATERRRADIERLRSTRLEGIPVQSRDSKNGR